MERSTRGAFMRRGFAIGILTSLAIIWCSAARSEESIRLETADTVLVFKQASQGVEIAHLGRPGDAWNWLPASQAFQPAVMEEVDHQFAPIDWKMAGIEHETLDSASRAQVRFIAEKPQLEMLVVWT